MSDQDLHSLGIYHIWDQQTANHVEQNKTKKKKEEAENRCVQAVHSFTLSLD